MMIKVSLITVVTGFLIIPIEYHVALLEDSRAIYHLCVIGWFLSIVRLTEIIRIKKATPKTQPMKTKKETV